MSTHRITQLVFVFFACLAAMSCDSATNSDRDPKPQATIQRIEPATGPAGSVATIYGDSFDSSGGASVLFGPNPSVIRLFTQDSIQILVPQLAIGPYSISFVEDKDTSRSSIVFTVTAPPVDPTPPRFRTIQLSLTGLRGEMYFTNYQNWQDTIIKDSMLKPVTITLLESKASCSSESGDSIAFCFDYSYPGMCNCRVELIANATMVIDTISKVIKTFSLSSDSVLHYGRQWYTFTDIAAENMPYVSLESGRIKVELTSTQLASSISSIVYRKEYISTTSETSFSWLNRIIGYARDAKLTIIFGP